MGSNIFWWCALVLFPPIAILLAPAQFFLGVIALIAGLIVLFTDSVIPNQYIWGAIFIFIIECLPPVRVLGGIAASVISGPDPGGRTINIGDSLVGSIASLIYNLNWLDFANSNQGCWLIYVNYSLACVGIWSFIGFAIANIPTRR